MGSNKQVQIIQISSVIYAVIVFLGFTLMKLAVLGIVLAVGVLIFGATVIHTYRTDFSDVPDE